MRNQTYESKISSKIWLQCTCGSTSHMVQINKYKSDYITDEGFFYIDTCVVNWRSFWERLKFCFCYLFRLGRNNTDYYFDSYEINREQAINLNNFLTIELKRTKPIKYICTCCDKILYDNKDKIYSSMYIPGMFCKECFYKHHNEQGDQKNDSNL